jgi:hypothetical protein
VVICGVWPGSSFPNHFHPHLLLSIEAELYAGEQSNLMVPRASRWAYDDLDGRSNLPKPSIALEPNRFVRNPRALLFSTQGHTATKRRCPPSRARSYCWHLWWSVALPCADGAVMTDWLVYLFFCCRRAMPMEINTPPPGGGAACMHAEEVRSEGGIGERSPRDSDHAWGCGICDDN